MAINSNGALYLFSCWLNLYAFDPYVANIYVKHFDGSGLLVNLELLRNILDEWIR